MYSSSNTSIYDEGYAKVGFFESHMSYEPTEGFLCSKIWVLGLSFILSGFGITGQYYAPAKSYTTSWVDYSSSATVNSIRNEEKARVIAMLMSKNNQTFVDVHKIQVRKKFLSEEAKQRILKKSLAHQKKWDGFACDVAIKNDVYYGGGEA